MEADVFILLDDAQYIRRGWVNRNRILLHGKPHAIRLPVANAHRATPINQIQIADHASQFLSKQQTLFRHAYGTSPGWPTVQQAAGCLADINLHGPLLPVLTDALQKCCNILGIQRTILMASDIHGNELRGERRMFQLIKAVGGTRYINLPGGVSLYDDKSFGEHEIELKFLKPRLTAYRQVNDSGFTPALSVLDILANHEPSTNWLDLIGRASLVSRTELMELK